MPSISQFTIYIVVFISLYFEVFLLMTYMENRHKLKGENIRADSKPTFYPTVSIIVPCWNEQNTLSKTVNSLLDLNYPKDKLELLIVDDGSTDSTPQVMQKFAHNPQVKVFSKPNGGKHTALNFGLTQSTSELVGCLDADSYVHKDALKNIILAFEADPDAMSITPSVRISDPNTIIQLIQQIEYIWAVFLRKCLSYIGAIYVTPGPFSIFKRQVFEDLGPYRYAHQTEDMELAMRMQSNHYKIGNAHHAVIYTTGPESLHKLYKQRVRWSYGFIKNAVDYKYMFFKKKYGNLGLFILPLACLSIVTTIYSVSLIVVNLVSKLITQIVKIQTVGFHWPDIIQAILHWNFDWFYVNTGLLCILEITAFLGLVTILFISKNLAKNQTEHEEKGFGMNIVYFLTLYSFIAPLWLFTSAFNALFSVRTSWR